MMKQNIFSCLSTPLIPWKEAFGADSISLRNDVSGGISEADVCWLDWHAFEHDVALSMFVYLIEKSAWVVVMSSQTDVDEAMGFFTRGARGYCHRYAAPTQLREIALVVEHRGFWLGSEAMPRLMDGIFDIVNPQDGQGYFPVLVRNLTRRERAVAREVAQGASNREIAHRLSVSERTVKAHLSVVFEKMQVRDRVQLALVLNNVQLERRYAG